MPNDIDFRLFQPGDEEEIVELLKLVFNGWPQFDIDCTSLDHWKWKFLDNPVRKGIVSLGISDNKIIGCNHTISLNIKIGDQIFRCDDGVDVATHPNYRIRGVYNKTLDLINKTRVRENLDYAYAVSTNPIFIKNRPKYMRLFPFEIFSFYRIKNVDLHSKYLPSFNDAKVKYGFKLLKFVNKLQNTFSVNGFKDYGFDMIKIRKFDTNINDFIKNTHDYYKFILERNLDYLNWRYCDYRAGNYFINLIKEDNIILGYSVLRINKILKDYYKGYIVDLLTKPDRPDVIEILISEAINYFDSNNINVISCLAVKNHILEKMLSKHGFIKDRNKLAIVYHKFIEADHIDELRHVNANQIHFSYGDLDWI